VQEARVWLLNGKDILLDCVKRLDVQGYITGIFKTICPVNYQSYSEMVVSVLFNCST